MREIKPRFEWLKYNRLHQYSIIVSCHQVEKTSFGDGPYRWCIYVQYQEGSKIDISIKDINDIPLHWGVSYDRRIYTKPFEKKYDWQHESKSVKIGADYNHCNDQMYTRCDPLDGIPRSILNDVDELDEYIFSKIKE